jgi:hypothetical protein
MEWYNLPPYQGALQMRKIKVVMLIGHNEG